MEILLSINDSAVIKFMDYFSSCLPYSIAYTLLMIKTYLIRGYIYLHEEKYILLRMESYWFSVLTLKLRSRPSCQPELQQMKIDRGESQIVAWSATHTRSPSL